MEIKIVHNDDWEALYINGLLYRDGHRIEPTDICSGIKKFSTFEISYDEEWINSDEDDEFKYPLHYKDLIIDERIKIK